MGCDLPTVVTDVLTRNLFHISCGTLPIPVHPSSTSSGLERQLLVHPGARSPGQNDYRPGKFLLKLHGAY